jgi:DeoR family transcriptional regulator, fructose operon transcriptional repressor
MPAVRLRRIQELLDQAGWLSLRDAQNEFAISEMTARRDFVHLERLGLAERTWGGVVARRSLVPEIAHDERGRIEAEAKEAIAELADALIEEGDTVFLSGGTTALAVARRLASRSHLTIITTSLPALTALVDNSELVVIAVGGRASPYNNDTTGPQAENTLATYRANKAVVGAAGISADGVFNANLERAAIDRIMVTYANEALVVADHTKIGVSALSLVTPLTPRMALVTDRALGPRERDWFDDAAVRVIAPDSEEPRERQRRTPFARSSPSPQPQPSSSAPDQFTKENRH